MTAVRSAGSGSSVSVGACRTAMETTRPDRFDCIQVNLAVVAATLGRDPIELLGGPIQLAFRNVTDDGLQTLDPLPEAQADHCGRLLGLKLTRTLESKAGQIYFAVADAYDLPWLPYHQREHMPHGFLLSPGGGTRGTVIDAYDNDTQWGPAEPVFTTSELEPLSHHCRTWRIDTEQAAPYDAAAAPAQHNADTHGYIDAFRLHHDRARASAQLTVDTWLMARRVRLHADTHPAAEQLADEAQRISSDAFIAHRRLSRGRDTTGGVLNRFSDLLAAVSPTPPTAHRSEQVL